MAETSSSLPTKKTTTTKLPLRPPNQNADDPSKKRGQSTPSSPAANAMNPPSNSASTASRYYALDLHWESGSVPDAMATSRPFAPLKRTTVKVEGRK
mmetsp:Transcript_29370/g.60594  ORF Transcript_29370/g.60594 Transcript_29370/m.60594 type:complete len:97 (-) Transcript_29370:404-694(-)